MRLFGRFGANTNVRGIGFLRLGFQGGSFLFEMKSVVWRGRFSGRESVGYQRLRGFWWFCLDYCQCLLSLMFNWIETILNNYYLTWNPNGMFFWFLVGILNMVRSPSEKKEGLHLLVQGSYSLISLMTMSSLICLWRGGGAHGLIVESSRLCTEFIVS